MEFWEKLDGVDDRVEDTDWNEIHIRNFKCSIDTSLRSFLKKKFTKQLPLTIFYSKLIVKIPLTVIFVINPESIVHIVCECDFVRPIWEKLFKIIKDKYDTDFTALNFDKIVGVFEDKFLNYLFLCLKCHIYSCKFQNERPE